MKPVQIGLLVVAGAIGGALVMRMVHKPVAPAQETAVQQQAPATPSAAPSSAAVTPPAAAEAPAAPEAEPKKPSPVGPENPAEAVVLARSAARAAHPKHTRHAKVVPAIPRYTPPVIVARNAPVPAAPAPAPTPQVQPQPETVKEIPAPAPAPIISAPARREPEPSPPVPPPAPEPNRVTLNAGMLIPVRLVDGLSSERNMPGDTFNATLDKELVVNGFVIAERGARVEGRVVASDRGGKVRGTSGLVVELTRLHTSDGQDVGIQTDSFERHAEASHREDATRIGAGAAVGAVIGAIAGGGKGAAIGAGVGGAAGAGDVLLTRGKPATLPSETRISFRLSAPVSITERRG